MSALAEALIAAQLELPTAIPRDSQGNGYRYTSLDKLIEATRPILNAHGLVLTQWPDVLVVSENKTVPVLVTRLEHASATYAAGFERMEYRTPLFIAEPKSSQEFGAAVTYARRYAWAAALGIASEEDTDAATYTPEEDVPL